MDEHDIEQAIDEELEKLSVNLSDMGSDSDADIEEDFTASNEKLENDLPDSVLAYFKASSNRMNSFEQLILEDLNDLETMCNEMFRPSQHADLLNELGSNFDEDPLKLKERIMSEIEEQVGAPCETHDSNGDGDDTEYDTHKDSERQFMFEWRRLEERLRKEEEQRLAELEAEREQCLNSAREEEEKKRRRSEQLKEELRRTEAMNQFEYLKPVAGDGEISQSLQLEMVEQQELIKRLEEQIAEERRVFEEVQQEEGRRSEARCTAAATKLQAAFRGTLVRCWSKKELTKRREEERRRQELRKERERRREREERMKMEWENERRRVEQEEQRHREEAERRRAEYERAKVHERHRLEREHKLEEQRRKEKEEAKRIDDERKRKEEEEKQKRMEDRRVEEERRKVQEEEEKKIKNEEKAKRTEDEIKRKDEVESSGGMEESRVEEERTRKEGEEAKRIEDERKRKEEEEKQKRMEERRVEEERKRKDGEEAKRIEDERKRKEEEEKQKRMEERRVEEERKRKDGEEAKRIEDERKRKEEEEKQKRMEERRVEEERRKVQEEEEKKIKNEEKAKRTEDEIKRKDEVESSGGMEERRVEEERTRKEGEEAKRIEDERKRKEEEEKQKRMEIRRMGEEKRKVQLEEEKERKEVEEAKRTQDGRKRKEEEKQRRMEEGRGEEEKKRKEEVEEKRTEAEIKRKEEEQKMMNEKRVVEEIRLKQKEQVKKNETEQMQKEQRKGQDFKGEEIAMKRNDDRQNMEERSRNIIKEKGSGDQRENPKTDKESKNTTKWGKDEEFGDNVSQLLLSQSVNMSKSFLPRTLSSRNGQDEQLSCNLVSPRPSPSTDNSSVTVSPSEEKRVTDTRGPQCALDDSSSACLPYNTEQKRLAWMMTCVTWSKLSMQNKRKGLSAPPRRRAHRRASGHSLLPLPVGAILRSGSWSSLKQVTSVTLEDLSGCSLSTLSECTRLQSLTLRRCSLRALDGLNQCTELQHIDLQENDIAYVDCGGLARLEVLLLGRNQLTSIHGLDDAVNLTVLQLSHNIISRISGLGSLKKLHRLIVHHNQLISTRGLSEAFTLLHLDCSYNHLSHIEGLENCALLNTLDLRGNNLTELPVLKNHVLLRELYLDDNSICSLHGLNSCWLPLLRCLSVPQNSITLLPLLVDLLSLKTLNVSLNCLSELRNICMSLQGCTHLQELSMTNNPVQQENNWRSSVLAVNPSLIKLNGEQTGASGKLSADSTQLWSFQALCQAHQDQIDSVLQRHSVEISSAPSALHAQLLVGKHAAELFQLAEEQRYAHEYGDSCVCETAMQEPVASRSLHELSALDLTQEKSAEAKTQQPAEHKTLSWQAPYVQNVTHNCQSPYGDYNVGCAGSCISPTQQFRDTQPSEDRSSRYGVQASRVDLKTVAVMVIQRHWREHRQRRCTGHLGTPAKAHTRLSPPRKVKSCKTKPECLNKDYAASVIQAVWRGYALRKRLTRALMLAQISEGDEPFEEVDMDEFIFDEEAMEKDWITLHSDMSPSSVLPYSEQLPLPKPLLPLPELHKSVSVEPFKLRQAWISGEEAPVSEQSPSTDPSTRMRSPASRLGKYSLSEKSEKILEEWGFSSFSTALLMLKRAQRMKAGKQQHPRKLQYGRGDVSVQEALRGEPEQTQTRHRTYQWLQTQAVPCRRSSASSVSDHFLPEIDPEILNGGRVQLVASTGYRESPDSAMRLWIDGAGFSSSQNHQAHTRTHSAGHAKKEMLSPQRVTLAPSQKERISFRDNPVLLSGGWGGGKKRSKANKLK
ncbi:leucine-rich repeat and IQ domain-containing protein 1 isoform X2 [Ictalurus furcatus]|uniref:leucine-rich repeat and IQ domain-containing protein 1 isoform X2 n=1 Tax=Ictalurus furcatus TaxID=66913 RepID=UPI002350207F|nr:leucine-rich repeat and IQ domain-containing protein 1 isoform X2 [Ictalurus furcatus]